MNHEPLTLTPEEQFILACLRMEFSGSGVAGFPVFDYESFDWDRVYKKSIQWRIAPLLYKILEKLIKSPLKNCPPLEGAGGGQIPKHFIEKIKVKYLITCVANSAIYKDLAEISEVFGKAGIPFILLKGSHLAQFVYKDIGLRPMGDIDILVKKEDLSKAEELLLQMGYTHPVETKSHLHLPYFVHSKKMKALEVHWTITKPIWQFNVDIEGLWERARPVGINGTDVLILSLEDIMLYISMHAVYQHNLRALGLTPYCDIAAIIHGYNHEIDWDKLYLRAHEWGVAKYLSLSLRLTHEIFGINAPDSILYASTSESPNEKIVEDAKKRILYIKSEESGFSDVSHLFYDNFHPNNRLIKRMFFVFRRIFISPEKLADFYGLPQTSRVVYFYHIYRIISLLYRFTFYYVRFILFRLTHKKGQVYEENLDLWILNPKL